jgi:hypothetical protein
MTELQATAVSILADHGIKGELTAMSGDNWLLTGTIGTDGIAVQIAGKPDEALITQAAVQIREELSDPNAFGR